MKPVIILAIILAAVIICLIGLLVIIMNPPHAVINQVLGTVQAHVKSKIPGLQCAGIRYTHKGRVYAQTTMPMPKNRLPKIGSKRAFALCVTSDGKDSRRYWLSIRQKDMEKAKALVSPTTAKKRKTQ